MAKPTINDVARLAGVSKKTVSRVINQSPLLNELTRAKVQAVIADIGYAPDPQARALAMRRNNAGGEAPPAEPFVSAPRAPSPAAQIDPMPRQKLIALAFDPAAGQQLAEVQQGILSPLRESGHALLVLALSETGAEIEDDLRAFLELHRPAGMLLLPPLSELKTVARLCAEFGCAHVAIGAAAADDGANLVASVEREAAARVVAYMVSLGHRRIGMITGPEDSRLAQERELGYLDALADHDLDRGPALIASGDHSFVSGFEAGNLLLEVSPCPTAIFAGNDEMAAGVLHAAAQKGVEVPGSLSVIGFGDTPLAARINPQLTTVRVPIEEMATAAARRLIEPDNAIGEPARFTTELVVRGSTGPCLT